MPGSVIRNALLAMAFFAAMTPLASAQDDGAYVGAFGGLDTRNYGGQDRPYLSGTIGGSMQRIGVYGGWRVNPSVSFGPEISWAGVLEGQQSERTGLGVFSFRSEYSELLIAATVRFHTSEAVVRFEPMLAAGFLTKSSNRVGQESGIGRPPQPRRYKLRATDVALVAGLDIPIAVSTRVAIVTNGRLQVVPRDDRGNDGVRQFGVSRMAGFLGIGARIGF